MEQNELYIDEPVVASFWIGEVGHLLQYFQGRLRFLKQNVHKDHKFIILMNKQFHPFVADFVYCTIDLPKEFYDLKLETDCSEAPPPNSPPGSFTPPNIYAYLIQYIRQFYNPEKAIEIWPPRGTNMFLNEYAEQTFAGYSVAKKITFDKPLISIFPRARARAANRNVPEFVWKGAVDLLRQHFTIMLGGTPSGACLHDYKGDGIINLISYQGEDKMEKTMEYLCNSSLAISSQSGPTHMALLSKIPSYIIGHEKERHAIKMNRFSIPASFRYVSDYRAIDAETIYSDVMSMWQQLSASQSTEELEKILVEDQLVLVNLINNQLVSE